MVLTFWLGWTNLPKYWQPVIWWSTLQDVVSRTTFWFVDVYTLKQCRLSLSRLINKRHKIDVNLSRSVYSHLIAQPRNCTPELLFVDVVVGSASFMMEVKCFETTHDDNRARCLLIALIYASPSICSSQNACQPPLCNNSSINVFLALRLILSTILDNASVRQNCKGRPRPIGRGDQRSPAPCHTELSMSGYRRHAAFCRFHFDVFADDPGLRRRRRRGRSAFLLGRTARMRGHWSVSARFVASLSSSPRRA